MKKMLIDAAHAEETRVAVVDGTRVEEFDFESRAKKQLRGNIYLAKVTRVEPSLQAAFVEYGGNRHGFLAFNEIHPDYYQIPVADREALLREEAEDNERHQSNGRSHAASEVDPDSDDATAAAEDEDDVLDEEVERRRRRLMRRYKIQEVIKRRQIMLVQVVKDERGGKGASLTTYLSLAGRYCVLMPNTARGGGVSRKITSASDRKRLKDIIQGLDVPEGMGLIVRTAGAKRTKAEIKRDYEYLSRLWENIRNTTMHSIAPALIYEEEDLVKRAIRDMYDKDIESVEVEGEAGYREARDFMRMLMPSQTKKVQPYREATPLFVKHRIEDSLAQIYSPVVPLRSGGYLVINQTEALVAIDVNSGKATRERNIESTALKTNLEAAEEATRQLRLRDLAGLIVIDFIDMEESKNNRAVEKRLKDGLDEDRARIQMGKISGFGLMELSRQRRRTGVLEGTTHVCPHCQGSGRVLSVESSALAALRAVDNEVARNGAGTIELKLPREVGLYILNEKRGYLARLQQTSGLYVCIQIDETIGHAEHLIERTSHERRIDDTLPALAPQDGVEPEPDFDEPLDAEDEAEVLDDDDTQEAPDDREPRGSTGPAEDAEGQGRNRGRSRRRRRGRRDDASDAAEPAESGEAVGAAADAEEGDEDEEGAPEASAVAGEDSEAHRRRRRRGRRGSRRSRDETPASSDVYGWTKARTPDGSDPYGWYDTAPQIDPNAELPANDFTPPAQATAPAPAATQPAAAQVAEPQGEGEASPQPAAASPEQTGPQDDIWVELPAVEPKTRSRRSRSRSAPAPEATAEASAPSADATQPEVAAAQPVAAEDEQAAAPAAEKPKRTRRTKATAAAAPEAAAAAQAETPEAVAPLQTEEAPQSAAVEAAAPPAPQPAPEPAAADAPAPATETAPGLPDPNEILAPPAQPKRGWWRRG